MNTDKQQHNRTPWQSPQLKILSISRDTEQDDDPIDPPEEGMQS